MGCVYLLKKQGQPVPAAPFCFIPITSENKTHACV